LDLPQRAIGLQLTPSGGGNFWAQGGSVDAGFTFFHGFGVAANFTGDHTSNIAPGVDLGLLEFMAGPRYTLRAGSKHESRVFAEALFGGVHGFDSVFPVSLTVSNTANSFAIKWAEAGTSLSPNTSPSASSKPTTCAPACPITVPIPRTSCAWPSA
jgi:hypothetical protein